MKAMFAHSKNSIRINLNQEGNLKCRFIKITGHIVVHNPLKVVVR